MLTEPKAMSAASNVTILPTARRGGDEHARDFLIEIVYDELRRLAGIYLRRERPEHTLQPTELINETYLKLVSSRENDFQNRAHFVGTAANAMRQILVDHARAGYRDKRGGKRQYRLSITTADKFIKESDVDLIELDDALKRLTAVDKQKSRIVELKFFCGLTIEETAAALDVSHATVERGWRFAKAWLRRELS